jgi:hypothetical protein
VTATAGVTATESDTATTSATETITTVFTTQCTLETPTPASDVCGSNYVYASTSNAKLLEAGSAATVQDCAFQCESTAMCVSLAFSAPTAVGELGVCNLFDTSVSMLLSSGLLIPAPVTAGQTLQAFYDLDCFDCPAASTTTTAPPLTTTTTTAP